MKKILLVQLLFISAFCLPSLTFAAENLESLLIKKFEEKQYSKSGADTCLTCHKKDEKVSSFLNSAHGVSNQKGPMAGLQCETCHGPQGKHRGKNEPMITFGEQGNIDINKQNGICLSCHKNEMQSDWHNAAHQQQACSSCHNIHAEVDPILANAVSQNKVCADCHQAESHQTLMRSSHPLTNGQMTCTACHGAHGTINDVDLIKNNINQTCYTCHADKRGPLLWEHAPVVDDCTHCHNAHGSVNDNLLKTRAPLLCQQCHNGNPHAAVDQGIVGTNVFNSSGSCLNCHNQIHGSNHPSGNKLLK
ncbi:MAG: DmsE family decaheme c-type cytochrome [Shewanella sp.]|uniref:DmsE family decaheme c-type cytochrome n=1 Tax=Shewanella sp. TaxID=50422 RepID=UPI003F3DD629